MSKDIRIKKGVNINLKGSAERVYASIPQAECFVVKPSDFKGLTPKLSVKAGDKVKQDHLCSMTKKIHLLKSHRR